MRDILRVIIAPEVQRLVRARGQFLGGYARIKMREAGFNFDNKVAYHEEDGFMIYEQDECHFRTE